MYEDLVKALRELAEDDNDEAAKAADAIEELQKAVYFHKYNSEFWEDKYNSLADEKWIPITERLPEKNGKYFCNIKRFGQYAGMQYYYVDVLVFQEDCFFEDGIGTERVTHWMPLPEPPKGE